MVRTAVGRGNMENLQDFHPNHRIDYYFVTEPCSYTEEKEESACILFKNENKNRNNGKIGHVDTTVNRCWYLDEKGQAYKTVIIPP